VKLLYIHAYRHRFGVEPICAVLSEHDMKIAPQTYYRWRASPIRPAELAEAYLVNQIVDLYRRDKCVYGVRKMWHAARRAGLRVGRDQVGRLMRIAGVQGVRRGTRQTTTTTRDERAARHPDLVKRGWKIPNRPDAVWVADFTYVWAAGGLLRVVHHRRLFPPHSGVAGVDEQDHRSGHRGTRPGSRDAAAGGGRVHRQRIGAPFRRRLTVYCARVHR
jgi:HTH-like domain